MWVPPPPPCNLPPLAFSHPAPGDRDFHVFLGNIYCAGLCCPCALHMALHCVPITSNQSPVSILWCSFSKGAAWVCCVAISDPKCFLPLTVYGTTHAHLVHMCWPLSWALHQMGHKFATFGTYALVGSLRWDHESTQLSRLEAVFSLLASMESTAVCLEIPLQSPPPHPGDRRKPTWEIVRGAWGTF